MKTIRMMSVVAGISLLAGCGPGSQLYSEDGQCITCWNNPITGEAINHDNKDKVAGAQIASTGDKTPSATHTAGLNKYCHKRIKVDKDIPTDVDLAYLHYKRKFGFLTRNEKIRARGFDPYDTEPQYKLMDRGYRHVATPGLRYQMKDAVGFGTGKRLGWLDIELEKAGNQKTRLHAEYCEGGTEGFSLENAKKVRAIIDNGYK